MKPTKLTWEEVSQFEEMPGYGQTIWQEQGNYFLVRSVGGVAEQRLVYNLSPELFQLLEAGQKNLSDVSFYIENDRWPPIETEKRVAEKQWIEDSPTCLIDLPETRQLFTADELKRLIPIAEQAWIDWKGKLPDDYLSPLDETCFRKDPMTTPKTLGFRMPAEYEPHQGTLMAWPTRPGSWPYDGKGAKEAFARIIATIRQTEAVYLLVDADHLSEAQAMLGEDVHYLDIPVNDAWTRDTGPTVLVNGRAERLAIDWAFNAWGGEFDGLYQGYEDDDQVASRFAAHLDLPVYDAHPFVLEGGAIHSDGEGTILVTESCLLSPGRNPDLTKEQIEQRLLDYLGAEKVIWLPYGIYEDETNEHVDNVAAFVGPAEIVLAWTDDETDPQYAMSKANLDYLATVTDAKGRPFTVHKLLTPKTIVTVTEQDLPGYRYEVGEQERSAGERLAASYVNFYITNGAVLVPVFNDEHDELAIKLLAQLFPQRTVTPIPARDLLLGGGNIHCLTQQIPAGVGSIRLAKEADGERISQLCALEGWQTFTVEVVKSLMNSSTYLVLEQDGAVVGFARYLTDGQLTTFVSELVVAESYRRQGLARKLLTAIVRKHPQTRLELISQADDCYEALGFRRVGTGFRYKIE